MLDSLEQSLVRVDAHLVTPESSTNFRPTRTDIDLHLLDQPSNQKSIFREKLR